MKKYSKYDTIDVEIPLRTFISGAKFRDPTKKIADLSNNLEADITI